MHHAAHINTGSVKIVIGAAIAVLVAIIIVMHCHNHHADMIACIIVCHKVQRYRNIVVVLCVKEQSLRHHRSELNNSSPYAHSTNEQEKEAESQEKRPAQSKVPVVWIGRVSTL